MLTMETNNDDSLLKPEKAEEEEKPEKQEEETASSQDWLSVGASWGSSWLKSAKEKTISTLELVKKDLSEFSDAVTSEATAIATNTVESVKQQAQSLQQIVTPVFSDEGGEPINEENTEKPAEQAVPPESKDGGFNLGWKLPQMSQITNNPWMKTLVETVKNIAQEETTADEEENTEVILPRSSPRKKDAKKSILPSHILYTLQTDRQTYTNAPEGDEQLFLMWQEEFDINDHDREINNLLSNCPAMREIYQDLVPKEISNRDFWERYFYKVYQTEMIERCKDVALDESFSDALSKEEKKATEVEKNTDSHDSPDHQSNNDETWSFCSSTEMEIQELHESKNDGTLTPKAGRSPKREEKGAGDSAKSEGESAKNEGDSAKGGDGWVDWEE